MIMDWVRILAYITGTVDQELLLCNRTILGTQYLIIVCVVLFAAN